MRASQNPIGPPPKSLEMLKAENAPIMYNEPCATLGTLSTPRTKLSPDVTINRIMARLSPTRNWLPKAEKSDSILGGFPKRTNVREKEATPFPA